MIVADGGGIINLWDIGSGKKLKTLSGHQAPVWSIKFSQEGSVLASGSGDCSVKIWNTDKVCIIASECSSSSRSKASLKPKTNDKVAFKKNAEYVLFANHVRLSNLTYF
mmetsp:Transcript_306/g.390  ORF Transcript_306/g.390 Transcript_306/m.390 type:complete len:109 (+) Transcript_306:1584-1910(+)